MPSICGYVSTTANVARIARRTCVYGYYLSGVQVDCVRFQSISHTRRNRIVPNPVDPLLVSKPCGQPGALVNEGLHVSGRDPYLTVFVRGDTMVEVSR